MRTPGRIHAADLERSQRLQRVLKLLSDHQEHSTLEIMTVAKVCAVNSCISELREADYNIPAPRVGKDRNGTRVWFYRLVPKEKQLSLLPEAA